MAARVGWAEFDALATAQASGPAGVHVGFAEFDALAAPYRVNVGWAEFDARAAVYRVNVGWVEFDVNSPNAAPVPTFQPGGGVQRYHSDAYQHYDVPVDAGEDEEEEIILALLLEIAAHALV